MVKLPVLSGYDIVKILSKNGFFVAGRRGSHVRMKKKTSDSTFIAIVPMNREIPPGTLKSIIRQSGLSQNEFMK